MKKRIIGLICICAGGLGVLSQIPVAWIAPHIIPDDLGADIRYSGTIWDGNCLLYTSPSPRDATLSRMPSSA